MSGLLLGLDKTGDGMLSRAEYVDGVVSGVVRSFLELLFMATTWEIFEPLPQPGSGDGVARPPLLQTVFRAHQNNLGQLDAVRFAAALAAILGVPSNGEHGTLAKVNQVSDRLFRDANPDSSGFIFLEGFEAALTPMYAFLEEQAAGIDSSDEQPAILALVDGLASPAIPGHQHHHIAAMQAMASKLELNSKKIIDALETADHFFPPEAAKGGIPVARDVLEQELSHWKQQARLKEQLCDKLGASLLALKADAAASEPPQPGTVTQAPVIESERIFPSDFDVDNIADYPFGCPPLPKRAIDARRRRSHLEGIKCPIERALLGDPELGTTADAESDTEWEDVYDRTDCHRVSASDDPDCEWVRRGALRPAPPEPEPSLQLLAAVSPREPLTGSSQDWRAADDRSTAAASDGGAAGAAFGAPAGAADDGPLAATGRAHRDHHGRRWRSDHDRSHKKRQPDTHHNRHDDDATATAADTVTEHADRIRSLEGHLDTLRSERDATMSALDAANGGRAALEAQLDAAVADAAAQAAAAVEAADAAAAYAEGLVNMERKFKQAETDLTEAKDTLAEEQASGAAALQVASQTAADTACLTSAVQEEPGGKIAALDDIISALRRELRDKEDAVEVSVAALEDKLAAAGAVSAALRDQFIVAQSGTTVLTAKLEAAVAGATSLEDRLSSELSRTKLIEDKLAAADGRSADAEDMLRDSEQRHQDAHWSAKAAASAAAAAFSNERTALGEEATAFRATLMQKEDAAAAAEVTSIALKEQLCDAMLQLEHHLQAAKLMADGASEAREELSSKVASLTCEAEALRTTLTQKDGALAAAEVKTAACNERLRDAELSAAAGRAESETLCNRIAGLDARVHALTADLAEQMDAAAAISASLDARSAERTALQAALKTANDAVTLGMLERTGLEAKATELRLALDSALKKVAAAEAHAACVDAKLNASAAEMAVADADWSRQAADAERKLTSLAADVAEAHAAMTTAEASRSSEAVALRRDIDEERRATTMLMSERDELAARIEVLVEQAATAVEEKQAIGLQLRAQTSELSQATSELRYDTDRRAEMEAVCAKGKVEAERLRIELAKGEAEVERLRTELAGMKAGHDAEEAAKLALLQREGMLKDDLAKSARALADVQQLLESAETDATALRQKIVGGDWNALSEELKLSAAALADAQLSLEAEKADGLRLRKTASGMEEERNAVRDELALSAVALADAQLSLKAEEAASDVLRKKVDGLVAVAAHDVLKEELVQATATLTDVQLSLRAEEAVSATLRDKAAGLITKNAALADNIAQLAVGAADSTERQATVAKLEEALAASSSKHEAEVARKLARICELTATCDEAEARQYLLAAAATALRDQLEEERGHRAQLSADAASQASVLQSQVAGMAVAAERADAALHALKAELEDTKAQLSSAKLSLGTDLEKTKMELSEARLSLGQDLNRERAVAAGLRAQLDAMCRTGATESDSASEVRSESGSLPGTPTLNRKPGKMQPTRSRRQRLKTLVTRSKQKKKALSVQLNPHSEDTLEWHSMFDGIYVANPSGKVGRMEYTRVPGTGFRRGDATEASCRLHYAVDRGSWQIQRTGAGRVDILTATDEALLPEDILSRWTYDGQSQFDVDVTRLELQDSFDSLKVYHLERLHWRLQDRHTALAQQLVADANRRDRAAIERMAARRQSSLGHTGIERDQAADIDSMATDLSEVRRRNAELEALLRDSVSRMSRSPKLGRQVASGADQDELRRLRADSIEMETSVRMSEDHIRRLQARGEHAGLQVGRLEAENLQLEAQVRTLASQLSGAAVPQRATGIPLPGVPDPSGVADPMDVLLRKELSRLRSTNALLQEQNAVLQHQVDAAHSSFHGASFGDEPAFDFTRQDDSFESLFS